jgi:beta-1,4-mannooligosaccharide/beta-1,4-mannosyl-N-acetylglucosamine phosphorylase
VRLRYAGVANEMVFTRHPRNPLVTAAAVPHANSVHNPAIVKLDSGGFAGVFRVDKLSLWATLHAGFSEDGLDWELDPEPLRIESDDPAVFVSAYSYDPRLTRLEDTYYLTWCNSTEHGPTVGLAATADFRTFTQADHPLPPPNRNCVLFPRRIGGEYALYHRPSDLGHTPFGDIYYATSPDLVHWGRHRFVFGPRPGWQSVKVGPGPAPIEVDGAWLLLYHGVWRSCNGHLYYTGGALLELERPWRVLHRTRDYLLGPTEPYERVGDVPNVCFASSAVVEGDTLRVYYGAADTCVAMATAKLADVVEFVKERSFGPGD